MLNSLFSGMTGVKNSQAQLDVISNNIANVNTTGFKANRITFADALSETISGARGTAGNFTGSNPIQIGRGSMISSVDTNFKQGSLDTTGIFTDIAINGKGFFVVTDGLNKFYTRAGGFQMTDDGYLMAQGGNYYVMGRTADANGVLRSTTALERISLPFGRKEPAKATTEVTIYCNLDKNASKVEEWLGKDQLVTGGKPAQLHTDLAMIDGNNIMLGDKIEITGTDKFGNRILDHNHRVHTFTYGEDGTTIQDFLDKINLIFRSNDMENGATVSLDQAGRLRLEANSAGENDFSIFLTPLSSENNTATTHFRLASTPLVAIQNNRVNQLNGGADNLDFQPGQSIDITYGTETQTFHFATGNETLQQILDFINDNFVGANVALVPGAGVDEVMFQDIENPGRNISFAAVGAAPTGLNGSPTLTLTSPHAPATTTTDLRHLMNTSISNGKTIEFTGRNPDGAYVRGSFTYGSSADGTTIQDLLNTINKVFYGVTATLSPDGMITMTNNATGESLSSIEISGGSSVGFNIDFDTDVFTSNDTLVVGATNTIADLTSSINDLRSTQNTPYQIGDVINIMATQMNGATRQVSFTFGERPPVGTGDGTTLGDLIDRINNSNEFPGMSASLVNGQIVFTDNSANDLHHYTSIQLVNGQDTIGKGLETNFNTNAGTNNSRIGIPAFTSVVNGETGKHHSAIDVFDSSGKMHRLDITYTQDTTPGSNKWTWEILIDEGKIAPQSGGSGYVTFNDDGSLREFRYDNGTQLRFNVLGAEEMRIDLDAGIPGSTSGMTHFESPSTNVLIEQNGHTMGILNNINIDEAGVISGIYSNGVSKALAQVALANFTNESGLMKEGNNLFSANASSGNGLIAWAGVNNKTVLKSGHLEASNVDLTEEFSKLIISQRALEANAKVINTADMVLQTIIDRLKR
ncbi:MAG: flagellar hook-basal body complex protein [Candidatus Cloacimonetes bacterium]|nr:flagellar hook-basal body complex protein [Candidatus Cloacimonadota bacterium]